MNARESRHEELINGRRTVALGWGLEKSLSAYASAAVAAGVSLLAATRTAEAKIVYTPAHTPIPDSGESIMLDLNHDGLADFSFRNQRYSFRGTAFALQVGCAVTDAPFSSKTVCRYQRNQIWGRGVVSGRYASALHPGFLVRPNKSYFQQRAGKGGGGPKALMAFLGIGPGTSGGYNVSEGQWLYSKGRYLGLKFLISGQVHYGWARVAVNFSDTKQGIEATLTGYAYETIPNKPIITGKTKGPDVITFDPASLGNLAQGVSGISAWRKSGGNWKPAAH